MTSMISDDIMTGREISEAERSDYIDLLHEALFAVADADKHLLAAQHAATRGDWGTMLKSVNDARHFLRHGLSAVDLETARQITPATTLDPEDDELCGFRRGDRVEHIDLPRHGIGTVCALQNTLTGDDPSIGVRWEHPRGGARFHPQTTYGYHPSKLRKVSPCPTCHNQPDHDSIYEPPNPCPACRRT